MGRFAAGVGELAAEQEQLDEQSRRLGLDFNEAAANAGRFLDEVDAMNAAGQFAARGTPLSAHSVPLVPLDGDFAPIGKQTWIGLGNLGGSLADGSRFSNRLFDSVSLCGTVAM